MALVAAEDTRLTRRLWARHGLGTRLISYHARNAAVAGTRAAGPPARRRRPGPRDRRRHAAGQRPRGEPGAWPGRTKAVAWCPSRGRRPSWRRSSPAGLPAARWGFEGFLPRSGAERRARLARIAADERTTVLFEAPLRTAATLRDLAAACGGERRAALCRELTKLHEEVRRGSLAELADEARERPPRGEVTLVVAGRPEVDVDALSEVGAEDVAAARRRVGGAGGRRPEPRRGSQAGRGRDGPARAATSTTRGERRYHRPVSVPVLREMTPLGRAVLVVTLVVSFVAMAMEWLLHIEGTPIFVVSALGILGLAYVVGAATERLGALTGPQMGGILNATFGNIAELIIAFFALTAGQIEVVKASLTGSIIGNLLLVLGASVLLGGLRNGNQRFSVRTAMLDATLLVLAVIGLFVPAVFALSLGR